MISVLFGLASALSLGTADFMARFSARAVGATLAYGLVLIVGTIALTAWLLIAGETLVWSPIGCGIAIVHGIFVSLMCILLYMGMARGPIAVVAPIVAAHPVLVLGFNALMGLRPSAVQWGAMAAIIAGGIAIARSSKEGSEDEREAGMITLMIAAGACAAYAALVITGQAAVPLIGEFQTTWIGRLAGLAFIVVILLLRKGSLHVPANWLPFVGAQGLLDTLGYFTFLAGANSAAPHITMVVASAFSVVTVLLARLILHEPVSPAQWGAIACIAGGTAVLSAS
jgi:drug/metabolite transporter (DMT)-like permease